MNDVDYVRDLLKQTYATEYPHEIPHPKLEEVIGSVAFDYLEGTVEGENPNGETSRDGNPYLWFKHANKSILSHRFISAVTLGKWVPRECNIDHVNHNPSDNRPSNLRITTPRDNAGNRREALLSDLASFDTVEAKLQSLKTPSHATSSDLDDHPPAEQPDTGYSLSVGPETRSGRPLYTGETKPGSSSGTYHGTTFGSWHWYPDGSVPDPNEYVKHT
ncbi:HNH endonuclease signature motif containing protein [Yoonia litorea]|uniref:HNH endonuclease n=1 Tax=Yoonia litorea TaxID=1123755 RepID=A0A1I6MG67_9RHOB|nr:HNH endonuclease signature motif containing protein [Yoonia litorea]SFS14725.1 HNH endonuclease [Yoonia litorea]